MTKSMILRYGLYGFFLGVGVGDVLRGGEEVFWLMVVVVLMFCLLMRFFGRWSGVAVWVVPVFFVLGVIRISLATTGAEMTDVSYFNDIPQKITIEGLVTIQPELRNNAQYIMLSAEKIYFPERVFETGGRVLIKAGTFPSYQYADKIKVSGQLLSPADFEGFSYKDYLAKDNVYSVMYRPFISLVEEDRGNFAGLDFFGAIYWLKSLIKGRIETYLNEPAAGIALGLLIGARSSIPQTILDDFQMTGLTHILAISGYNITLIINVFAMLMGRAGRRPRFWVTCAMIGVFAVLTGLSASVVRASVMGVLAILAVYVGRKGAGLQMLMFSGFLMVAANPLILLRDISFQLSFLSTLGLLVLLPLIENFFKRLPPLISESLAVTLAATVFTTPVVLLNFERFSLISPLANVIFLPLIPMIMFMSFLAFCGSLIFAPIAYLFAAAAWFLIEILLSGVGFTAKIPFAMIEIGGFTALFLFAYYGILFAVISFFRKSKSEPAGFPGPVQV